MDKIKYINNRDLLAEIHKSKRSYCYFVKPEHANFDAIVTDLSQITSELIAQVYQKKIEKLELLNKKKVDDTEEALVAIPDPSELVFRVMTDEHIPVCPSGKMRKRGNGVTDLVRTVFPPFKHYMIVDGAPVEVARSFWKNGFDDGEFCSDGGRINNRLAQMFMLLTERYSRRGNVRNYSYNDEMRGLALMQLSQTGLQFDESKSDNPFAFYTQIIKHSFVRVINLERKVQDIRDDLLIVGGASPSNTRQIENELAQRFEEANIVAAEQRAESGMLAEPVVVLPKKRGRKPKGVE